MMELYTFELQLADKLTENDLWVKAFPYVRMSMEKAMEVMGDRMDTFMKLRCGGFAIRHLLLSGFVIRFDFIINILFNNGNVQQTFLPSIVYR